MSNNGHTAVLNVVTGGDSDGILSGWEDGIVHYLLSINLNWLSKDTWYQLIKHNFLITVYK